MIMVVIANGVVLFALAFLLFKQEGTSPIRKFYWPALGIKLVAGISLGLLYTYYYTIGDTFSYLHDGIVLADLARTDSIAYLNFMWQGNETSSVWNGLLFQQERALFLGKVVSMMCLISADNYWIVSLYFSFASFCSAWFLVKVISRLKPSLTIVAIIGFLFFPSVVFWTSGVIKESLAMTALYFLVAIFLKVWMSDRIKIIEWLLIACCLWVLWNLKYYYLAVFLPVITTALVLKLLLLPRITFKHWSLKMLLWCLVFIVPLYVASMVHPNFYPERFLNVIVENYAAFLDLSQPEDVIHYARLEPTVESIFINAPQALFSGLFRPFIWEANTSFQFLVSIENFLLLIIFISSITFWKSIFASPHRLLTFSVILYVVLLSVFLALSTPNFGTLSRYRVGFLPFFFLLIAHNNPLIRKLVLSFELRTTSREL